MFYQNAWTLVYFLILPFFCVISQDKERELETMARECAINPFRMYNRSNEMESCYQNVQYLPV